MRLYEFEASQLFARKGIPMPHNAVVSSPQEAREKAEEIGLPVVLKAQILAGGRGVAGAVQTAESLDQVEKVAEGLLGSSVKGLPVQQIMVAQKVDVAKEFYAGITIDGYHGSPVAIISSEGGVSINQIAQERPESVATRPVSMSKGLRPEEAREMCREVGMEGYEVTQVASMLTALYRVFESYDATVAEINPLVRTAQGTYLGLDAKLEIDDSSLYRHKDLELDVEGRIHNPLERKGREIGVTYVELDGDIGLIASGAGLGMASMDIIVGQGLKPANFLETGGGITEELLYNVMDLVLQKEGLRAVFINVYGGINPIHEGAKGVVKYMEEYGVTIPIVAKALGNHQEETWEIFRNNGVHVVTEVSTEKAIDYLAGLLEGTA
ncbi:MAG: succinate--CoA ligase subunit beta [Dehalococcoidia bacterium]